MVLARKIDADKCHTVQFRMNPYLYGQLVFVPWGEHSGKIVLEKLDKLMQNNEIRIPILYHTQNSKLSKDLNIGPDTIKLLEENVEKQFLSMRIGKNLLAMTTKAQITKKNQQMGLH